jgi:hypothetical protein
MGVDKHIINSSRGEIRRGRAFVQERGSLSTSLRRYHCLSLVSAHVRHIGQKKKNTLSCCRGRYKPHQPSSPAEAETKLCQAFGLRGLSAIRPVDRARAVALPYQSCFVHSPPLRSFQNRQLCTRKWGRCSSYHGLAEPLPWSRRVKRPATLRAVNTRHCLHFSSPRQVAIGHHVVRRGKSPSRQACVRG